MNPLRLITGFWTMFRVRTWTEHVPRSVNCSIPAVEVAQDNLHKDDADASLAQ